MEHFTQHVVYLLLSLRACNLWDPNEGKTLSLEREYTLLRSILRSSSGNTGYREVVYHGCNTKKWELLIGITIFEPKSKAASLCNFRP